MPIYEYRCLKCDRVFEKIQKVDEGGDMLKCPYCGAEKPEKIFSRFSSTKAGEPASSCSTSGQSSRFS